MSRRGHDLPVTTGRQDLEHATLALGALYASVPFVPVSPAYSLVARDFGKLRGIVELLTPAPVFAADAARFAPAIAAAVPAGVEVVSTRGEPADRPATRFEALLATAPTAAVDAARAQVGLDSIAKFLLTSGSTRAPKAVVNTHRTPASNQQVIRQRLALLEHAPAVLVDWLPWNHTFGGNHNVGIVLYNGGTLCIDGGKPTPAGFAQTVANLREISPTIYLNVPRGFEELAHALGTDAEPPSIDRGEITDKGSLRCVRCSTPRMRAKGRARSWKSARRATAGVERGPSGPQPPPNRS